MLLVALVVPVLLSGCRSKKEVINRESEVRVDSSLNSSSGKSLVKIRLLQKGFGGGGGAYRAGVVCVSCGYAWIEGWDGGKDCGG